MTKPKKTTDTVTRQVARRIRDSQWRFADRVVANGGRLWLCTWNKNRHFNDRNPAPPDTVVCGLMDGMELLGWFDQHPDWWSIGEWDEDRYAMPVAITEAGRAALAEREKFDMEPVIGGLVEPGWQAVPLSQRQAARIRAEEAQLRLFD